MFCIFYRNSMITSVIFLQLNDSTLLMESFKIQIDWRFAPIIFCSFLSPDEDGGAMIEKCYSLHSALIAIHYAPSMHKREALSQMEPLCLCPDAHGVHLSCRNTNCQIQCPVSSLAGLDLIISVLRRAAYRALADRYILL